MGVCGAAVTTPVAIFDAGWGLPYDLEQVLVGILASTPRERISASAVERITCVGVACTSRDLPNGTEHGICDETIREQPHARTCPLTAMREDFDWFDRSYGW